MKVPDKGVPPSEDYSLSGAGRYHDWCTATGSRFVRGARRRLLLLLSLTFGVRVGRSEDLEDLDIGLTYTLTGAVKERYSTLIRILCVLERTPYPAAYPPLALRPHTLDCGATPSCTAAYAPTYPF